MIQNRSRRRGSRWHRRHRPHTRPRVPSWVLKDPRKRAMYRALEAAERGEPGTHRISDRHKLVTTASGTCAPETVGAAGWPDESAAAEAELESAWAEDEREFLAMKRQLAAAKREFAVFRVRDACTDRRATVPQRARRRGAGRPRVARHVARATSSADPPSDSDGPRPRRHLALVPPPRRVGYIAGHNLSTCAHCGRVLLWSGGRLIC